MKTSFLMGLAFSLPFLPFLSALAMAGTQSVSIQKLNEIMSKLLGGAQQGTVVSTKDACSVSYQGSPDSFTIEVNRDKVNASFWFRKDAFYSSGEAREYDGYYYSSNVDKADVLEFNILKQYTVKSQGRKKDSKLTVYISKDKITKISLNGTDCTF